MLMCGGSVIDGRFGNGTVFDEFESIGEENFPSRGCLHDRQLFLREDRVGMGREIGTDVTTVTDAVEIAREGEVRSGHR